jgi:putative spermidine/putrescine transport system ATP-binding protein
MPALELRGVAKDYHETRALHPTDLAIEHGEFVAILGPSGCGKTTILRIVSGILEPTQGEVWLAGSDISSLPPERRGIGFVFQTYALFPHMTVRQNLAFGLKMQRLPKEEQAARISFAAQITDLGAYLHRYPRQLSGGQQQRVALARAVALHPKILLLDEPLSNLDAKLRETLRDELLDLHRKLRITTVYVTHDQAEAMAMADRIVVMRSGRVVEVGKPEELYRRPRRLFTAKFLGQTNIIPIEGEGGEAALPWGQRCEVGGAFSGKGFASVRPEDIELIPDEDGPGVVERATFMGAATNHIVLFRGERYRSVSSGPRAALREAGSRVILRFGKSELHALEDREEEGEAR